MATNLSMVGALERIVELTDELNAWKAVLKWHIVAQKKQRGQDWKDYYEYNPKTKKCRRI